MAKPYKYQGILAKPKRALIHLGYFGDPDNKEYEAQFLTALDARDSEYVDALFADCNARRDDPDGWMKVARTLAERHVKGFQPDTSKPMGRRPVRARDVEYALLEEMQALINTGKTIRSAARIIAGKHRKEPTEVALDSAYRRFVREGKAAEAELRKMLQALRQKSAKTSAAER